MPILTNFRYFERLCMSSKHINITNDESMFNTLRLRQNGRHFPKDVFYCFFLTEILWISDNISLNYVPLGLVDNMPSLVQNKAWRRISDKPLPDQWWFSLLTQICVTRPQWVNRISLFEITYNYNIHLIYIYIMNLSITRQKINGGPGWVYHHTCLCVSIVTSNSIIYGLLHTVDSAGDSHMTYAEYSTQINSPKWVIFHGRMCTAVVKVIWVPIAVHRPGWYSPITCTTLVSWLVQRKVVVSGGSWRSN